MQLIKMRAWLRIAVGAIFTFLLVAPLKSEDQLSQEVEVEVEESKPKGKSVLLKLSAQIRNQRVTDCSIRWNPDRCTWYCGRQ